MFGDVLVSSANLKQQKRLFRHAVLEKDRYYSKIMGRHDDLVSAYPLESLSHKMFFTMPMIMMNLINIIISILSRAK